MNTKPETCERCGVTTDNAKARTAKVVAYTEGLQINRHVYCQACWYGWAGDYVVKLEDVPVQG